MTLRWWKSSRSGSSGGHCVEVAVSGWWKSSRGGSEGGACVEVAVTGWRKARRSGSSGGACVEVADDGIRWYVRDSKNPGGGMPSGSAAGRDAFVGALRADRLGWVPRTRCRRVRGRLSTGRASLSTGHVGAPGERLRWAGVVPPVVGGG
ncbi:MAG TPA: DUF397 domain-containing protein [Actinocatenispora sp.]